MHHHYKVYSFSGDNWSIYFVSSPSTPLPIEYIQEFRFPWHNYFLPEFPFVSNFRNQMFKDIKWLLGSLTFCRRMPSWCFVPCASCPWNLSGKDPQIQSKLTVAMVICYPVTREFVFCLPLFPTVLVCDGFTFLQTQAVPAPPRPPAMSPLSRILPRFVLALHVLYWLRLNFLVRLWKDKMPTNSIPGPDWKPQLHEQRFKPQSLVSKPSVSSQWSGWPTVPVLQREENQLYLEAEN